MKSGHRLSPVTRPASSQNKRREETEVWQNSRAWNLRERFEQLVLKCLRTWGGGSAPTHPLWHSIRPAAFDLHEPSVAFLPSQRCWDAGEMVNPSFRRIKHHIPKKKRETQRCGKTCLGLRRWRRWKVFIIIFRLLLGCSNSWWLRLLCCLPRPQSPNKAFQILYSQEADECYTKS